MIERNKIKDNWSQVNGAGLAYCDGTIRNNVISGNAAELSGGGLYGCHGTIENNTIVGNSAGDKGGGLCQCDGMIRNSAIVGNSAEIAGGGLYDCHGTILSNTITANSAGAAGGGLEYCHGTIHNNTITGNSAGQNGGGLYNCGGTIQNNTITANSAEWGGGLFLCQGSIQNCILWGNTAPNGPQFYQSSIPTFSCIQGWSGPGNGNTASEPRFLDPNAGDYRLQGGSPCIDAGYNDPSLPATDIAGMRRIMFGGKSLTVDMGAYEFHIWPPTENTQTGEITLKWSSLMGKAYSVYHSGDMLLWDVLADNVSSAGDTVTTWVDSMGPVLPPGVRIRYYKVMENP